MRRTLTFYFVLAIAFASGLGVVGARPAQAQQSVNFFVGGFVPRQTEDRDRNDVLVGNSAFLSTLDESRGIDAHEFRNVTVGGEWLPRLGDFFEAGLGLGYYQRTVPTVYTRLVNANGSEIEQDLKLRIVPFTATIRFLPFGRAPIEPYIGGGVGVYAWRYTESGQFVDTRNNIFTGTFTASGSATGPVILGGVRIPIGPVGVGGEIRWQGGSGDLPRDQDFAGSKIDLGGVNYLFVISVKF